MTVPLPSDQGLPWKVNRHRRLKARLHVEREGTARLETSTGSRRNLPFTRTNSVMYLTKKGTVLESLLERVLAVYTLFSSRPVTIEPAIIKQNCFD